MSPALNLERKGSRQDEIEALTPGEHTPGAHNFLEARELPRSTWVREGGSGRSSTMPLTLIAKAQTQERKTHGLLHELCRLYQLNIAPPDSVHQIPAAGQPLGLCSAS